MSSAKGSTARVLVIGAGIAGLAAALRLSRAGREVLVLERAPARRRGGYLVNLVGPGYDAAERLGLLPALAEHDLGVFTSVLTRADGSAKFTVPAEIAAAALGRRTLSVFRGDLESVLYRAVRDLVEIRFGTTVTTVEPDADPVRAVLSDGSTVEAELVIGADGLHSATRAAVFGPESGFRVDLNHVVAAFPLPEPPDGVADRTGTTFIGPHRTAAVVNLGPDRSSAFFTYRSADPEAELARGPAEALAAAFGDLGGGVPAALAQLGADSYLDTVGQIVMPAWSRDRVVLLGDAAWCVTLFAGHGAGLALAGADRLVAALDEHRDVPTALADWERGLRPEVIRRQADARKGIARFAPPTRFHVALRDLALRAVFLPGVRDLVRRAARRH